MKKTLVTFLLALTTLLTFSFSALADDEKLFVVDIDATISSGVADYIERTVNEADAAGNATIIFNLNTYGGYVDAADTIKSIISGAESKTVCFINDKAISAGALIALSCDEIYMMPSATIGAAEPISGDETASEKTVSYWTAQLRSTAEQHGRNGDLAAAMADADIAIDGIIEVGKLLTLTATESINYGMANGIASSLNEVISIIGMEGVEVEILDQTTGEQIATFLTSPTVQSILLTLGMAGIVLEIFFAGFGIFGIVGVGSLVLYFMGGFLAGSSGIFVLILFVAGLIFLAIEIFATPGVGIMAILGAASLFGAILLSTGSFVTAIWQILFALIVTIILVAISLKWGKTRRVWNKLILSDNTSKEAGYSSQRDEEFALLGMEGITISPMRPAGVINIAGKRIDAVAEGGYIDKDKAVIVSTVDGGRVVVKEK